MKKTLLLFVLFLFACTKDDAESDYYPPKDSTVWEIKTFAELGWKEENKQDLLDYLELKNTKSFMILVDGKIVLEHYFGSHTESSVWYWASAGKTLTATITGIAEQENYIKINNKVSDYLGTGWTSAPLSKENLITCKHLLTMTSGLDDDLGDNVDATNLQYVADAGTRWAYHNVYVKLQDVIANATQQDFLEYFNTKLRDKIGMTGFWYQVDNSNVYWSNTRSMARFGLLALRNGKWKNEQIINTTFLTNARQTSQNINLSYGYLWWLNGKNSFHLPQSQMTFNGSLISNAPNDMYAALGKNDQKIYVVPSKKMVIIRMGEAADNENFGLSDFDNQLWLKIKALYN